MFDLSVITVVLSALGSASAAWIAIARYHREVKKSEEEKEEKTIALAEKVKNEQQQMEHRLRQEQIASEMAQAELENSFRNEIRQEMMRVREEARELQKQLRAAEEENRKLRLEIFNLQMELARFKASIPPNAVSNVQPGTVITVTSVATPVEVIPPDEGLSNGSPDTVEELD